ncbi:MAG TPA: DUF433 domain-containing protein [Terriglobia bacterium]|nr:DUF433 domain-containing protein [Terriglobia bacterium]
MRGFLREPTPHPPAGRSGLRIPVHLILRLVASGKTPAEVVATYPELELADIQQAMEYAAWLASEKTVIVTGLPK